MPQPPEVEALSADLRALYQRAWTEIMARQEQIAADLQGRKAERLARMRELQQTTEALMSRADEQARAWVASELPRAYQLGATQAAAGFTWSTPHLDAVTLLARETYGDLLAASTHVKRTTRTFIKAAARTAVERTVVGGQTAQGAARAAARQLIEEHGIHAVVYKNGARHGLAEYAEMATRSISAKAYNVGAFNQMGAVGIEYAEALDGVECIAPSSTLEPYGNLVGIVRGWYSGSLRHITVALPGLPRPDSRGHPELLLDEPDRAHAAPNQGGNLSQLEALCGEPHDLGPVEAVPTRTHSMTIGPNHPVMTRRGWVPASLIREDDQLVYDSRAKSAKVLPEHDLEQVPSVEDLFTALLRIGGSSATRRIASDDLHGDGRFCQGEVQVVRLPRGLLSIADPSLIEHGGKADLMLTDAHAASLPGASSREPDVPALMGAPSSVVGGGDLPGSLGGGSRGPLTLRRTRAGAELPLPGSRTSHDLAALLAGVGHGAAPPTVQALMGAEAACAVVHRGEGDPACLAGSDQCVAPTVALPHGCSFVPVLAVEEVPYEGWVYDATTAFGTLNVDGIVLRNCGLSSHDDSRKANGLVLPLDEARQHPTSHPNCRRSWAARPEITSREHARNAKPSTTEAQRADQAAVEAERDDAVRRRANTKARRASAAERRGAKQEAIAARRAARIPPGA